MPERGQARKLRAVPGALRLPGGGEALEAGREPADAWERGLVPGLGEALERRDNAERGREAEFRQGLERRHQARALRLLADGEALEVGGEPARCGAGHEIHPRHVLRILAPPVAIECPDLRLAERAAPHDRAPELRIQRWTVPALRDRTIAEIPVLRRRARVIQRCSRSIDLPPIDVQIERCGCADDGVKVGLCIMQRGPERNTA